MADPQKMDMGDWAAIVALISGGIGSLMAFFRRNHKQISDRMAILEGTVYGAPGQDGHDTQLAVLRTCQENTNKNLDELQDTTKDTNKKVDTLVGTLTEVLIALKTQK